MLRRSNSSNSSTMLCCRCSLHHHHSTHGGDDGICPGNETCFAFVSYAIYTHTLDALSNKRAPPMVAAAAATAAADAAARLAWSPVCMCVRKRARVCVNAREATV